MSNDTDAQLKQDFGDLSTTEELLAAAKMQADFLYESRRVLGMYDRTEGAEQLFGLKEEVERALGLAKHNLAATLQKISESEIENLYHSGIISEQDCAEAIKTKRGMKLSREARPRDTEQER